MAVLKDTCYCTKMKSNIHAVSASFTQRAIATTMCSRGYVGNTGSKSRNTVWQAFDKSAGKGKLI